MIADKETRKEIFRKTAGTAIENSHNAIKQVWVVLFAGGTFALINSFDTLLECAAAHSAVPTQCKVPALDTVHWSRPNFWIHFSFYIIYVLTFYRFYVGNIRVFDMRYIEVVKFVASLSEKIQDVKQKDDIYKELFLRLDQTSRVRDSIFLMFKTLVIISLTIQANNSTWFMVIYFVLMLMDILWMIGWADWAEIKKEWSKGLRYLFSVQGLRSLYSKLFEQAAFFRQLFLAALELRQNNALEGMFPSRAVEFWTWNNLRCVLLLLPALILLFANRLSHWLPDGSIDNSIYEAVLHIYGMAVMFDNCIRDLRETWGFYNPAFTDTHEQLLRQQ